MTDQKKASLQVFTVEIHCATQWGDAQQVLLDRLLHWSSRLGPEAALKLVADITTLLNETIPGAMAPIAESGSKALDALGKNKQLPLLARETAVVQVSRPTGFVAALDDLRSAAIDRRDRFSNAGEDTGATK